LADDVWLFVLLIHVCAGVSKVTCPATGQAEWVCADCTRGFMAHGYAYRGRWSKSADFEEDDGRAGLLE
jgi:hypothetical protein